MDKKTEALIEKVAKTAADNAVQQTLITIGIDPADPIEVQKDMASMRELRIALGDKEFQKDLAHLRNWRKTMENIESKGLMAGIALVCTGGLALIVYAFKMKT